MHYFVNMDMLGEKPRLRINNSTSYKNSFGSSISISIYLLSITVTFYFLILIYERTKSNIVFSVLNTNDPPPLYLTSDNYTIAIAMEDANFNFYIDDSIYKINAIAKYIRLINETWDYRSVPVNLVRCQMDNFPKTYQNLLSPKSIENTLCFEKNASFLFNGTFPSGRLLEVFIYVSQCKNSTSNNNSCKPQKEIDSMLNGNYLGMFYTEISIDPSNIKTPNQVLIGDFFRTVSNKYVTSIIQTIKNVIIESDYGYLYESIQSNTYVQTDKIDTSYTFSTELDYFVSFMVQLSPVINIYKRSYAKAQDIAAQIGGVVNFLILSGHLISINLRKSLYYSYLSNFIFEFQKDNKSTDQSINLDNLRYTSRKTIQKDISLKSNNYLEVNKLPLDTSNLNFSKFLNNEKKKLKFNFKEILSIIFCKCLKSFRNKKLCFLEESKKYAERYLDIENLIRNLNDMEKLKKLLFDPFQMKLFNLELKPRIKNYEMNKIEPVFNTFNFDDNQIKEAYQAIMRRSNSEFSNFDNKIFKMIELFSKQY